MTSRVIFGMPTVLDKVQPDIVMVQGDTTTAMTAALAAFYKRIPVAHIEAGLRSHDINSPFPEELNRKIVGDIAMAFRADHRCPRQSAPRRQELDRIFVTGNTVIDTLLHFSRSPGQRTPAMTAEPRGALPFSRPIAKS